MNRLKGGWPLVIAAGLAVAALQLLFQVSSFPSVELQSSSTPATSRLTLQLPSVDLSRCDSLYLDLESTEGGELLIELTTATPHSRLTAEQQLSAGRQLMALPLSRFASLEQPNPPDHLTALQQLSLQLHQNSLDQPVAVEFQLHGASAAGAAWREMPGKMMRGLLLTFAALIILLFRAVLLKKSGGPRAPLIRTQQGER